MMLKPGGRLRSQVCTTEVVVVRGSTVPVDLTCGGEAMVALGSLEVPAGSPRAGLDRGAQLGKRYAHESGFELLVTKAGAGSLGIGHEPLEIKDAKPLPSSD
jgi:hypothetical protein